MNITRIIFLLRCYIPFCYRTWPTVAKNIKKSKYTIDYPPLLWQKAVTSDSKSKQLLPFALARQSVWRQSVYQNPQI